jgi:hypothetical protein
MGRQGSDRGRPFRALPRALAAAFLAASLAAPAAAEPPPLAAGVRAGTAGVGVDLVARASEHAHVRLAAGTVGFDGTISTSDLDYDAEAEITTALLLLDWYPGAGTFRLSLGAGWNGTEVEVTAPLADLLPLDPEELALLPPLGSAVGTARGDELVPVVLLGWGNPFRGGRWNLAFEIGAFYQGQPEVELGVRTGIPVDLIPGGPEILALLIAEEERELERELEDYRALPVVSLSLTYSF